MLKKIISSIVAAAAGLLLATNISSAAVFDFVAIADSGIAYPYGEKGGDPLHFTSGATHLDAYGSKGGADAYAYLDKSANPPTPAAPAGLGVCGALTGTLQCTPGYDDNVQATEILTLDFVGSSTQLVDWGFNGASHGSDFMAGDYLNLRIDNGAWVMMSLFGDLSNFDGLSGTVFDLEWGNVDFYLANVSAVPLPPAVLLFGAALFGLGWLGRRRKMA